MGELPSLILRINLGIILGSKSEQFRNIETPQNVRFSNKRRVYVIMNFALSCQIIFSLLALNSVILNSIDHEVESEYSSTGKHDNYDFESQVCMILCT